MVVIFFMSTEARDYEADLLRRFESWAVYLHEDQSYLGRTYVALNRGGDNEELDPFLDTDPGERFEFIEVVDSIKTALDELYQPTRLNYANLRNTWHHCHWHVIPRYEGPDFGRRTVSGLDFHDMNPGRNYAPSPKHDVPPKIFSQIHADMSAALAPAEW